MYILTINIYNKHRQDFQQELELLFFNLKKPMLSYTEAPAAPSTARRRSVAILAQVLENSEESPKLAPIGRGRPRRHVKFSQVGAGASHGGPRSAQGLGQSAGLPEGPAAPGKLREPGRE